MTKIRDIKKANKKEKALLTDAWYSQNVMRPISLFITKPFLIFEPTTICFTMCLIGLLSIPFFAFGTYLSIILGGIIFQIHYLVDHIDGNIARAKNKKSWRGKYLDFIPNILVNPLILIALGFGIFRTTGNLNYLIMGISAGFFYLAQQPIRLYKYCMFYDLNIEKKIKTNKDKIKSFSAIQKINKYLSVIFEIPGMMNLLLIFSIFGISRYLLFIYGFAFPLLFIARATYEFYSWKKRDNELNKK